MKKIIIKNEFNNDVISEAVKKYGMQKYVISSKDDIAKIANIILKPKDIVFVITYCISKLPEFNDFINNNEGRYDYDNGTIYVMNEKENINNVLKLQKKVKDEPVKEIEVKKVKKAAKKSYTLSKDQLEVSDGSYNETADN